MWQQIEDGNYLKALLIPGIALILLVFYLFVVILGDGSFTVAWRRLLLWIETESWGTAHDWDAPRNGYDDPLVRRLVKRRSPRK
jgi:hypothetical protein